jgi:hypothetical protein
MSDLYVPRESVQLQHVHERRRCPNEGHLQGSDRRRNRLCRNPRKIIRIPTPVVRAMRKTRCDPPALIAQSSLFAEPRGIVRLG